VRIDTHFLGNSRYWGAWEIADIGVLVNFRHTGRLLRTRVALLQSKRLYPHEEAEKNPDAWRGFGKLLESDDFYAKAIAPRTFAFSDRAKYRALQIDDEQYAAIRDYEALSQIPVYYLFYNPFRIPLEVSLPASCDSDIGSDCIVGCRVLPAHDFREAVAPLIEGRTPSYKDLCRFQQGPFSSNENMGGWRFESFIVDELLGCRRGYRADGRNDQTLAQLFGGRSAPIYAAVSVNIDAPASVSDQTLFE
jgi:hypothetical protein